MNALTQNALTPSTASRPDLDWSQVRETILMLNLSMTEIELALNDSTRSVGALSDSFTSISGALKVIREAVHQLPDTVADDKAKIENMGSEVSDKIGQAIVAFQFYDRLSQRLSLVCRSLDDLSGLVSDSGRLYNPNSWVALQQKIRAKYVTEEDRAMFDMLMETRDVNRTLEEFRSRKHDSASGGDIELF